MKRKIVFWLPQGRLGNLIFQYQAAISLFPENSIIISLKTEFSETFENASSVKQIPYPKRFERKFTIYWLRLLRWFVKKGVISSIKPDWSVFENYPIETIAIENKQGWFSSIFVIEGFFQHDHFAFPKPKLKKSYLEKANKLLHQIPQENRVAVHLRFGDYEKWTIFGKQGVCLPREYYQNAMARFATAIDNPVFIIFSDDKEKAQKIIGNKFNVEYFDGDTSSTDIAGISLCSHAIISASTFAWWGAFLINNPMRIVVAPKYWAGFKSGIWFPVDIQTKCFEYIDAY